MRSVIIAMLLVMAGAFHQQGYAQIRKIPAVVTDAFKYKYRNAESVEWKDKLSHFIVSFHLEGDSFEAYFRNDGTWTSSQKLISRDDLPEDVIDGFEKSKYAEWEIDNYYELIFPDDHLEYRLLVSKSDLNKRDLTFNKKGRLLKDRLTL